MPDGLLISEIDAFVLRSIQQTTFTVRLEAQSNNRNREEHYSARRPARAGSSPSLSARSGPSLELSILPIQKPSRPTLSLECSGSSPPSRLRGVRSLDR